MTSPCPLELFRAVNELDFRAAALRERNSAWEDQCAADIERVARWLEARIDPEALKRAARVRRGAR